MAIYCVEITVAASLYVRANSEEEARKMARTVHMDTVTLESGEVEVSGKRFDDPDLPELSLSPVGTCQAEGDMLAYLATDETEGE